MTYPLKVPVIVIAIAVAVIGIAGYFHFTQKRRNKMDTTNSEKIVKAFREKKTKMRRQSLSYSSSFDVAPEKLFPLLCPAREADWIPGWTADLIYTDTGYAEELCVFKTDSNNSHGPGIWIFTGYKLNESVTILKIAEDLLTHMNIILERGEDGQTTATWNTTLTALTDRGNSSLHNSPSEKELSRRHQDLISNYLKHGNTEKSEQIVREFNQQQIKYRREQMKYSGTWKTDLDKLFPLFCPVREADWVPGWDTDLVYTDSGYAENLCVFRTDDSNPTGAGIWTFTGYENNKFVQFVKYDGNTIMYCLLLVNDNGDGTVSATWNTTLTALTEEGNRILESNSGKSGHSNSIQEIIQYYLENGRCLEKGNKKHFLHHR